MRCASHLLAMLHLLERRCLRICGHWGEVQAGIATITAPIVEAFVPQMLNYESVGGVNFKKGCYPGQEVVARSQFRGTLETTRLCGSN